MCTHDTHIGTHCTTYLGQSVTLLALATFPSACFPSHLHLWMCGIEAMPALHMLNVVSCSAMRQHSPFQEILSENDPRQTRVPTEACEPCRHCCTAC